jgi:hypothetical protein
MQRRPGVFWTCTGSLGLPKHPLPGGSHGASSREARLAPDKASPASGAAVSATAHPDQLFGFCGHLAASQLYMGFHDSPVSTVQQAL